MQPIEHLCCQNSHCPDAGLRGRGNLAFRGWSGKGRGFDVLRSGEQVAGREEDLYRRPSSDDSFRGEVKAMQQYLGIRCHYFIREIESPEANVEFKTDGKKAVEIADQGKPCGPAARRSAGSASRSGPSSGALAIGQAGAIEWR